MKKFYEEPVVDIVEPDLSDLHVGTALIQHGDHSAKVVAVGMGDDPSGNANLALTVQLSQGFVQMSAHRAVSAVKDHKAAVLQVVNDAHTVGIVIGYGSTAQQISAGRSVFFILSTHNT